MPTPEEFRLPFPPSEEYYELLAVAQHHGLPTRLLDWSKRSYIAVYFAASSYLQMKKEDRIKIKKISVWVIDLTNLDNDRLKVIQLPTAISVNLSAQYGLFTDIIQNKSKGKFKPFYVNDILTERNLWKISIESKYASKLIEYCNLYAISAETLFPGVDGAVRSVKDRMLVENNKIFVKNRLMEVYSEN